jgi:hypothetical protein
MPSWDRSVSSPTGLRSRHHRLGDARYIIAHSSRIMAPPSPLSAPCAADEVTAATEAGPEAESFVMQTDGTGGGRRRPRNAGDPGDQRGAFGLNALRARPLYLRDAVASGGSALPKDNPPNVTRFKSAAAKRLQAHRARARMGLRCLTVRVSDREVRHLISTGYLSLESRDAAAAVAIALEAWISDNLT